MSKRLIIINTIISFIFLSVGFFIGHYYDRFNFLAKRPVIGICSEDCLNIGYSRAKKEMNKFCQIPTVTKATEIDTINGQIVGINGNKITIKVTPIDINDPMDLIERIVEINSETKISAYNIKDSREYQKEMAEYNKGLLEGKLLNPPDAFSGKREIKIEDLKSGQWLTAIASENIRSKKVFVAKEVIAQ